MLYILKDAFKDSELKSKTFLFLRTDCLILRHYFHLCCYQSLASPDTLTIWKTAVEILNITKLFYINGKTS